MPIHLTILVSFLISLITSSFLTGQVSFPCSTVLYTHAEYKLPFAPKGKPLLAKEQMKTILCTKVVHLQGLFLKIILGSNPLCVSELPISLIAQEAVIPLVGSSGEPLETITFYVFLRPHDNFRTVAIIYRNLQRF